jgi:hypothetical protein
MPRAVRNFFVKARVDGRDSLIQGGPRKKNGGLHLTLYQRSDGRIATALEIICTACSDGTLRIRVKPLLPFSSMEDGQVWIDTRR